MDFARSYEVIRGSEVERNGMFLELWERRSGQLVLWAFYSDTDGSMEFEQFRPDVPPPVRQWFEQLAWTYLPPIAPSENSAHRG